MVDSSGVERAARQREPAGIGLAQPLQQQARIGVLLQGSAAEIRSALQQNPDSRLLLERLRETYTRRLALSRRALYA